MKKKVVAMVTLAMFIMTLLPMAAFAADENSLTVDKTEATVADNVLVTVNTKDAKKLTDVEIWVEKVDEAGKAVENAQFTDGTLVVKDKATNGVVEVA